jgi:hypothetical protein
MALVKLNNRGVRSATTFGSITGLGSMVFIKKQTASSSATISFVDGTSDVVLDDTYKEYLFTFNNIHPATNNTTFDFNISIDSGSNYNVAKTTTFFRTQHGENDAGAELGYETGMDLAQGTGVQNITQSTGNGNDESSSGYLHLFNPSSTTFVKHFIATSCSYQGSDYQYQSFVGGYGNTTSAVDAIQFSMSSGNIDAGDICLYGIN